MLSSKILKEITVLGNLQLTLTLHFTHFIIFLIFASQNAPLYFALTSVPSGKTIDSSEV